MKKSFITSGPGCNSEPVIPETDALPPSHRPPLVTEKCYIVKSCTEYLRCEWACVRIQLGTKFASVQTLRAFGS